MEKQKTPSASKCPYCGGEPEHDVEHLLSALGYTHDDQFLTCEDCETRWVCGVPVGEYEGPLAEDLFCDSCQSRYGFVHRVKPLLNEYESGVHDSLHVEVHMKCPNQDCFKFWNFIRDTDDGNVCLMGFPHITGAIDDDTEAWGWNEGDDV